MIDRFRISNAFVRRLAELGVASSDILWHAGLPPGLFEQERITVTTQELFSLWRALGEVSRDPGIGLKLGCEERVERYDPLGLAALYARSYRDAVQRIGRYKQLTCPEEIRIEEQGNESVVTLNWQLAHEAEHPLLLDMCFACLTWVGRWATDGKVSPSRVELARPDSHRAIYETFFACPVRFDARRNALVYRQSDLDRPFLTHNPELSRLLAPQLEAEFKQHLAGRTMSGRVKVALKRRLAGQRPFMQPVARELGMSARTLQRRLADEGVTFQHLLEESRRELAHHYLVHASLELTETAYLLGYEDTNSFFRAFQHWEGVPPGRWRAQRLDTPVSPVPVEVATPTVRA